MRHSIAALFLLGSSVLAQQPQQNGQYHPGVDQAKVNQAISKGVEHLRNAASPGAHREINNCDELILLTLISSGLTDTDAKVKELLDKCLAAKLERTYKAVALAMSLEELDRVKYQTKIWQCGQFLVDNQAANGQWSYGEPTIFAEDPPGTPSGAPRKEVASGVGIMPKAPPKYDAGNAPGKMKPKPVRKMPVEKKRPGPAGGDDSNSQYAALGIRACHDSGIVFPKDVIQLAKKWWVDSQHKEEKGQNAAQAAQQAGAAAAANKPADVASGPGAGTRGGPTNVQILGSPRGWCYQDVYGVCKGGPAYSSMTTGAVGALCIYDYVLGINWRGDKAVMDGLAWLAVNWSVTENVGPSETEGGAANAWLYYYLYAVERVGMLYDTKMIGAHDWYLEGAKYLLENQKGDGSWLGSKPGQSTWDTCFAILFLKRATNRLDVATGGRQ
jgi:hypothetical protein